MTKDNLQVNPSKDVDFFLPETLAPVGKAHDPQPDGKPIPKIFTPLTIKNTTFHNRIGVSPMCTYSASPDGPHEGEVTSFHLIHYGSFAQRGAGLITIEAAAVDPNGRLSPHDLGIYNDNQALKLKEIVQFAHSQGTKIGIQIVHAGRKSSGTPPYNNLGKGVGKEYHGWGDAPGKIVAPSAIAFSDSYFTPEELTTEQIEKLVQDFKASAKRAYEIAGFDFVEIHGAHGYLISSFLSKTSNKRTDKYGGSFENRIRFLLEIVDAVKDDEHPLFVRISASELLEEIDEDGWTIEDTIKLTDELIKHGIDLLDVSSSGNSLKAGRRKNTPGFQVPLAKAVKEHVGDKLTIASVGRLEDPKVASSVIDNGDADFVLIGSHFLKNPGQVITIADALGVRINFARQYEWPFYPPKYG